MLVFTPIGFSLVLLPLSGFFFSLFCLPSSPPCRVFFHICPFLHFFLACCPFFVRTCSFFDVVKDGDVFAFPVLRKNLITGIPAISSAGSPDFSELAGAEISCCPTFCAKALTRKVYDCLTGKQRRKKFVFRSWRRRSLPAVLEGLGFFD